MINNEGFLKDIDKLESIINEYLSHWEIDKITKRMIAMDYIDEFGLEDMIAFINFCKKNDMKDDITPTLAHDINGMKSDCFLPRTSGYAKKKVECPQLFNN